jgi:hypothetical protein
MPPTVLREGPFRCHFFSIEGPRAHIHVVTGGGAAKVWLDTLEIASWKDLTASERRQILKLVEKHRDELQRAWDEHFSAE